MTNTQITVTEDTPHPDGMRMLNVCGPLGVSHYGLDNGVWFLLYGPRQMGALHAISEYLAQ